MRLEVYHDKIAVWSKAGEDVPTPENAREVFSLVVGAYALLTRIPLDWSLDGWIEATNATIDGAMLRDAG